MKVDSITELIGGTPLLRIDPRLHGLQSWDLFAKLEMCNPFGSVKDRTAWAMLSPHLERVGSEGRTLVEFSSGNTAKALAVLAGMHGIAFRTVTNRMKVPELKAQLLLLGASIDELPGQAECLDPDDPEDPLAETWRNLEREGRSIHHTDQYFNPLNIVAHETGTGEEILADLEGRAPDVFVTGVGTAGSSTGVARVLRRAHPGVEVVGVVSASGDFIPGIRTAEELREVGLFDPATYDRLLGVTSADAIEGSMALVRAAGLLCGPTAGAAFQAALRHLGEQDQPSAIRRTAVFIVCDRLEPYVGYIRQRRPDLFGEVRRSHRVEEVGEAEAAAAPSMDVASARRWLGEADPLVIDLRGGFAFRALHIPGSVNIAEEVFAELCGHGLPVDPARPVLLACALGERSRRYAALLGRLQHPKTRSLEGGMLAWRDAGAPLVASPAGAAPPLPG
jgi:cysteine synthase B